MRERERKRASALDRGLGTGYATVIMLFVVITLTVLAALSLSAAGVNTGQADRSREFTQAFYDAENRANEKLMKIDEEVVEACAYGNFGKLGEKFAAIEGVTAAAVGDGYTVSWTEQISDRVVLQCEAEVYEKPELHGNKRFSVTKWNTVSGGAADTRINVWDGTF